VLAVFFFSVRGIMAKACGGLPPFNDRRVRALNGVSAAQDRGAVVYWMSRDQRSEDNWALLHAQELALGRSTPLHVVFCLVPKFLDATLRHFDFMIRGLREVEENLRKARVPFHLRMGLAVVEVPKLCEELGATTVVCDMSPLRVPAGWSRDVAERCGDRGIRVLQVDAHNVIPVWIASDKQEHAARTIRKKIMLPLPAYLTDFPALIQHPHTTKKDWPKPADWEAAYKALEVDRSVGPVPGIVPGSAAGLAVLEDFCAKRLSLFATSRNDPNVDAVSGLSPYLHFGQVSAQRCALRVRQFAAERPKDTAVEKGCEAFIEESVVRRELADNFCFYNPHYDSIEGAPGWAQQTLKDHETDAREYVYDASTLEVGTTHDDLWNASQLQMVREGKMHGFLRMYWAKKILEWSPCPRDALATAIRFNDRYSMDGRDPNGYVGCMWSICGVHDMGWTERKVFGKIRFMNYAGCKRKMQIPKFVARYAALKAGSSSSSATPSVSQKRANPRGTEAAVKKGRKA